MAFVLLPGGDILFNFGTTIAGSYGVNNTSALDAAGESCAGIGRVCLAGRTGSKTISAAGGGRIIWRTGTAETFANAGTTVRLGVQDVSLTTGLEDGTFDVSADLVGGTDTIAADTVYSTAMESGSKTIAHGDLVAFSFEVISRAGSDTLRLLGVTQGAPYSSDLGLPYGTVDTGTLGKTTTAPCPIFVFDDGTLGWFEGPSLCNMFRTVSTTAFNSGSATDEYCGALSLPVAVRVNGLMIALSSITPATDTFEVVFYLNPLGSPSIIETLTPDPDALGSLGGSTQYGLVSLPLATPYNLAANTVVGVALRPTSVNNINWVYVDLLNTDAERVKAVTPFATFVNAGRADQTGAFVETQTYHLPLVGLQVSAFDDGTGGGATYQMGVI